MSDVTEQSDHEILNTEVSDEALEVAACVENLGGYTEFAFCTQVACPGWPY